MKHVIPFTVLLALNVVSLAILSEATAADVATNGASRQANFLMNRFGESREFHFGEILGEMREKIQVVVTFVALLELIRARRVNYEEVNKLYG